MREIIRMVIVLTIIAAVSGMLLSFVQKSTATPIANNQLKNILGPKLDQLFPERSNDPIAERQVLTLAEDGLTFYPVKKDGELAALAMEVFSKGYKGEVGILVGIDVAAGRLVGMRVTKHHETPGLGARAEEAEFYNQFDGLALDKTVEVGGPIDAISGATITSTAVCSGVTMALKTYQEHQSEIVAALSGAQE